MNRPESLESRAHGFSLSDTARDDAYNPLEWNVMHERKDLLPCPFCAYASVEEQKGNKERQYRIACGNPHCEVNPHTFAQYDLEEVVIAWQLRK